MEAFKLESGLRISQKIDAGADPEVESGGRIRRGDAEGVFPSTLGEGSGVGAVPPPQKIFVFFKSKSCVFKGFFGCKL